MGIQPGAQAAPTSADIQSRTGHDVMYFKALAFCEAVLPNTLTSKAKARIVSGRDDTLFLLRPRLRGAAALSVMGPC